MSRRKKLTAADRELIQSWNDSGIITVGARQIRSHRAPSKFSNARAALFTAGVLAVSTTLGAATLLTSRNTEQHVVMRDDSSGMETPSDFADVIDPIMPTDLELLKRELSQRERVTRSEQRTSSRTLLGSAQPQLRKPVVKSRQYVTPVRGARLTSCWGMRNGRMHVGIDFAAPLRTPIVAVTDGVVVQAGWQFSGLGNSVVVNHGDGYLSLYGHASRVLVRPGQRIAAGTKLALVGETGTATGPHLHFGVAKTSTVRELFSTLVDSGAWLEKRGVDVDHCG